MNAVKQVCLFAGGAVLAIVAIPFILFHILTQEPPEYPTIFSDW